MILTASTEIYPDIPLFHSDNKKVLFAPLENNQNELAQKWLGKIVKSEKSQWADFNSSRWKGGGALIVPHSTDSGTVTLTHAPPDNLSVFLPRVLIIVEKGSKLILLDEYSGAHSPELVSSVIEIIALEGSEVHYVHFQNWEDLTQHHVYARIHLQKNAAAAATTYLLGGGKTTAQIEVSLQGEGSKANLFGLVYGTKDQVFEHYTLQEHLAPRTESDLLIKTALKDKARSYFNGLIWIEKGASKTNAYQKNRNLLLSSEAKAETTPRLEILDNDVRCSHGASVGPVDEEQIFYLESRGIPRPEAEALIVGGFFQELMDKIPVRPSITPKWEEKNREEIENGKPVRKVD